MADILFGDSTDSLSVAYYVGPKIESYETPLYIVFIVEASPFFSLMLQYPRKLFISLKMSGLSAIPSTFSSIFRVDRLLPIKGVKGIYLHIVAELLVRYIVFSYELSNLAFGPSIMCSRSRGGVLKAQTPIGGFLIKGECFYLNIFTVLMLQLIVVGKKFINNKLSMSTGMLKH